MTEVDQTLAEPSERLLSAPLVSVIIPHLNQVDAALRCLTSIASQSYPANHIEVILVDNGSQVALDPIVAQFPTVRLLEELQPGPGHARNKGVANAKGAIFAFIDADCIAHSDWLQAAVAALPHSGEGVVKSGIVGGDVRIAIANPSRLTGLEAYESVFAYRQKMYIEDMGFSGTGNLATTRQAFSAVGAFGGITIAEDREWGRRASSMGCRTRYIPEMIVWHPARISFAEIKAKWQRQVAHDLSDHHAAKKSAVSWYFICIALVLSVPVHTLKIVTSPRLTGVGNRMRGVVMLGRVRWFRASEMIRQILSNSDSAAGAWNR